MAVLEQENREKSPSLAGVPSWKWVAVAGALAGCRGEEQSRTGIFSGLRRKILDVNWISSEPCAFVGPSHECTASVTPRIWVLGRDTDFVQLNSSTFRWTVKACGGGSRLVGERQSAACCCCPLPATAC
ncbi:hypothetical protein SLEP1_g13207 [Rubroshorea leprosula]|uniref:Uncharacterized protein n=1 Tax=Rubroshorea leprosula TaxID=152421 RepID=A0AAV5IF22_9ROSI|nr:hypothetical protein SLEP1_g13207 [Rubroshorea leprosula]